MSITIDVAKNRGDIQEAFKLACEIFSENTSSQDYCTNKRRLWESDPNASLENLILARSKSGDIVGLVRIVPRTIFRQGIPFHVAGLSSICISSEYRGRGLSRPLMEYALQNSKNRGFDLAILFARRALDHYYTKFGFWGVSSYSCLSINKPLFYKYQLDIQFSELNFDSELTGSLNNIYNSSYAHCFGMVDRSAGGYWHYLQDSLNSISSVRIRGAFLNRELVGYVIENDGMICEFAYRDDERNLGIELLSKLSSENRSMLSLEIPPQHKLVTELAGEDISFSYRECTYGGHMVKILNSEHVTKLCLERTGESVELSNNKDPSYSQTCEILGAYSITMNQEGLPLNISLPDRF